MWLTSRRYSSKTYDISLLTAINNILKCFSSLKRLRTHVQSQQGIRDGKGESERKKKKLFSEKKNAKPIFTHIHQMSEVEMSLFSKAFCIYNCEARRERASVTRLQTSNFQKSSNFVKFELCQVWALSSLSFVKFELCQVWALLSLNFVKFELCQARALSSLNFELELHFCTVFWKFFRVRPLDLLMCSNHFPWRNLGSWQRVKK